MIVYSYHPKKADFIKWDLTVSYEEFDSIRRYKVSSYKRLALLKDLPEGEEENVRCIDHRRSFVSKDVEYTVNNVFRFGKYANQKIDEVRDLRYTSWYYTVVEDESHKKFIHDYLYENWYDFRINENGEEYIVTPKRLKYEDEMNKKVEMFIKNLDTSKKYLLEPTRNPNREGKIFINGIPYIFPKVEEYYYEDCCYYLPVQNGKSKRIKNKVLECNLMVMDGEIFISNFKIIKL